MDLEDPSAVCHVRRLRLLLVGGGFNKFVVVADIFKDFADYIKEVDGDIVKGPRFACILVNNLASSWDLETFLLLLCIQHFFYLNHITLMHF